MRDQRNKGQTAFGVYGIEQTNSAQYQHNPSQDTKVDYQGKLQNVQH